jgi:ATP-dependent helicase/nuclease subunit B
MGARVFNIPTGIPFADALAVGLLERHGDDADLLARVTVLLPTRRACRSLGEAFLRVQSGTLLLPLLRPLGDVEEDALVVSGFGDQWEGDTGQALDLPPSITPLRRQMMLARLVMQTEIGMAPDRALFLASELGTLLDLMQTEEIGFKALENIVPADLAEHWQKTLDFMGLVTRSWPEVLAEDETLDPAERRKLLMKAQADQWRAAPPTDPVYAAGSTGTVPATAELMAVICALPNGAIVLPGLDMTMDRAVWDAIDPTHPQATIKHLIGCLGVDRNDVVEWKHPLAGPKSPDRVALVAQALRPAAAWDVPDPGGSTGDGPVQTPGLHFMECASPESEARAIAVVLRETLETPNRTAALVTRDRDLARRVAAELTRWGLKIDDSAGVPLAQTSVGSFLRLTADMIAQQIAPVPLLAALKHPLASGGMETGTFRAQVRRLERAVLRGTRPAPGFEGIDGALKSLRKPRPELRDWLKPIAAAAAEFEAEIAKGNGELASLVRAHVKFAEFLAGSNETAGDQRLWAHADGEAASAWVSEVLAAASSAPNIDGGYYPLVLDALVVGSVVRPAYGRHPRLHIWGTLEARLQQADVLVLGGLNEGTWPMEPSPDPWLSRPMRAAAGLPLPEQRVGLAAHDFVQAVAAPVAVLTRSTKIAGQPTVPSRWLERLAATMNGRGIHFAPSPWLDWQDELDQPDPLGAVQFEAPAPTPPLAVRPRQLSATQIETWVRDPYGIYARFILKLRALDAIDEDPGAKDRGTIIHDALNKFMTAFPVDIPDDAVQQLVEIGKKSFGPLLDRPGVWAFWWPRFERMAEWFVGHEKERRLVAKIVGSEVKGTLEISGPGGAFVVTAIADRIEKLADGSLVIVDYKTGAAPENQDIESGFSPQLAVEAVIAAAGGFDDIDAATVSQFATWQLRGGVEAGKVKDYPRLDVADAVERTGVGLVNYIAAFEDLDMPYRSQPRPENGPKFSDYDHLARVQEWSATGDEE